ncbi:class I SAM-dependent methyltransferase [Nocardioides donggukensis]|uniref:Class I SAM-dependent methyltransferase n=1 Tax=Nocardioides donggukensis TaxID=2774019 RepID=A0A927KB42_9ACTN|nr:hypothetical protein [Nocardioides donggukensis]MBD8870940.1 hypothetical protein [Nocardioides donggukensis]
MDRQHATGRPAFPSDAVAWLVGPDPRSVVVLGPGGVGGLAAAFAASDHDVTEAGRGTAADRTMQRLPDRSVDVVVAGQGLPDDLAEVARVLRPGGQLALVWNERDQRIPWARKLDRLLETRTAGDRPEAPVVNSGLFGYVADRSFTYWQVVNHESLAVLLREELAALEEEERETKVAAALDLYADYGRGRDGMQMPWISRCFKATVVESAWASPRALDEVDRGDTDRRRPPGADTGADSGADRTGADEGTGPIEPPRDPVGRRGAPGPAGDDATDGADLLLIDFR